MAWNKTAEFVDQWFVKGQMAIAEGRLQIRDWTDRDGNKRKNAEIICDRVFFGESKRKDEQKQETPAPAAGFREEADDGTLPF